MPVGVKKQVAEGDVASASALVRWWTKRSQFVLLVAIILLVASLLVVFHSTKDAGTWWLVGATAGLALLTGYLAIGTARTAAAAEANLQQGIDLVKVGQDQVAAAHRQADVATRALEADRQPVLIPTSGSESLSDRSFYEYRHKGVSTRMARISLGSQRSAGPVDDGYS
jgi:hypothetical protein